MKKIMFLLLVSCTISLFAQKNQIYLQDSLPEPKIKFKNWDKKYLPLDLFDKNSEIEAICENGDTCKILSYTFSARLYEGYNVVCKHNSDKYERPIIDRFRETELDSKFNLKDIIVQYKNGIIKKINPVEFIKIDNEFSYFVRSVLDKNSSIDDFGIFKSDIRIKIAGNYNSLDYKIITDLVKEIKPLFETVNIKIVDKSPNYIIFFRHDSISYSNSKENFLKTNHSNPFLPALIEKTIFINNIDSDTTLQHFYDSLWIRNIVTNTFLMHLANFNKSTDKSLFQSALWGYSPVITELDKQIIKKLYSSEGQYELKKITETKPFKLADNTILIIIISFLIFLILSELVSKYNYLFIVEKIKIQLIRKLIFSLLLVQIPIVIFFSFQYLQFEISFAKILKFELFSCLFACFVSILLAGVDYINNKIKILGVNLVIDLVLTTCTFILCYQLVLLFETPELLKIGMLQVQWLYIPLTVAGYRFYLKFSKKRLSEIIKEKELEIAKQKEVVLKSELLSMQSRINPHFLYNALNSIASLVHISADKTEEMTLSLAKLFRYNINKSGEINSTIGNEIEMVQIYLNVELVRFSDRMKYIIEVDKDIENITIPVFLLQPLVENAIKHGISKLTGQGIIKLKIFVENMWLIISIFDNGPEFPSDIRANYGLQSIFDKLKLLYKEDFSIQFINSPEKNVKIKIKQNNYACSV